MLNFFRRYQKFFFLFTTVTVVASFAFFGTYQVLSPLRNRAVDEIVFRTIDHKPVRSSYYNQMVRFLSQENDAPPSPFRPFVGNFLNDGVVTKDFLEGGLIHPLFERYRELVKEDLDARLNQEKCFTPFVHASAPFLSAVNVWQNFAPEIIEKLPRLQALAESASDAAFGARIELFLAQKRFPAAYLAQVLRYQERESQGFSPDPRLARGDLALFGYHELTDWFGPKLIEKTAETVMNLAAVAKEKGYTVTRDEALADLLVRSEQFYQRVKDRINLPISTSYEFFEHALRMLQFDEGDIVSIWQQILLSRRLMNDVGNAALIDHLPLKEFFSHANEYATIELYQMPDELRLQDEGDLKAFEAYLAAVAPARAHPLALPAALDPVDAIEKRAPELVGQRFVLEVGSVNKKALEGRVSVKRTWEWEVEDQNWKAIVGKFPELALKEAPDFAARSALLDKMEPKGRQLVDAFARAQIVAAHPEWIDEALEDAALEEKHLLIRSGDSHVSLPGISDLPSFAALLSRQESVDRYTQDEETYLKVRVKQRPDTKEILSFTEAKKAGVLNARPTELAPVTNAISGEVAKRGLHVDNEQLVACRFIYPLSEQFEEETLWKVTKKIETVTRSEGGVISLDEALSVAENTLSPIKISPQLGAYCFKLIEKRVDRTVPIDKLFQEQELLATEVKQLYFRELLNRL